MNTSKERFGSAEWCLANPEAAHFEIERLRSALEAIVVATDARGGTRYRAIAGQVARSALGQSDETNRGD
jgi:hypothetical protein